MTKFREWQSILPAGYQHSPQRDMIICTEISSNFFFYPERKYPGSPPNLKLDILYVSHYGFVDKGTKNNGSLKIKLLCFLWWCLKCRLFYQEKSVTKLCGRSTLANIFLALSIIIGKGCVELYTEIWDILFRLRIFRFYNL